MEIDETRLKKIKNLVRVCSEIKYIYKNKIKRV